VVEKTAPRGQVAAAVAKSTQMTRASESSMTHAFTQGAFDVRAGGRVCEVALPLSVSPEGNLEDCLAASAGAWALGRKHGLKPLMQRVTRGSSTGWQSWVTAGSGTGWSGRRKGDTLMRTPSVVVGVFVDLGFLSSAADGYSRKQKTGVGTRGVPSLRELARHFGVAAVVIWVIAVFRVGGGSLGGDHARVGRTGGPVVIMFVFFCGGRRRSRGHARRSRLKHVKEVKILLDLHAVCVMVGVADKSASSARGYAFA
jgi:hypothetical protein